MIEFTLKSTKYKCLNKNNTILYIIDLYFSLKKIEKDNILWKK